MMRSSCSTCLKLVSSHRPCRSKANRKSRPLRMPPRSYSSMTSTNRKESTRTSRWVSCAPTISNMRCSEYSPYALSTASSGQGSKRPLVCLREGVVTPEVVGAAQAGPPPVELPRDKEEPTLPMRISLLVLEPLWVDSSWPGCRDDLPWLAGGSRGRSNEGLVLAWGSGCCCEVITLCRDGVCRGAVSTKGMQQPRSNTWDWPSSHFIHLLPTVDHPAFTFNLLLRQKIKMLFEGDWFQRVSVFKIIYIIYDQLLK